MRLFFIMTQKRTPLSKEQVEYISKTTGKGELYVLAAISDICDRIRAEMKKAMYPQAQPKPLFKDKISLRHFPDFLLYS